jgi:hypothetical protein
MRAYIEVVLLILGLLGAYVALVPLLPERSHLAKQSGPGFIQASMSGRHTSSSSFTGPAG